MNSMKIIHYIPCINRMAGGISTYMQVLAKPLGTMAEVHIMTHASENPLPMENRLSSLPWERHGATLTVLRLVHG